MVYYSFLNGSTRLAGFVLILLVLSFTGYAQAVSGHRAEKKKLQYEIKPDVVSSGYDGVTSWFHPHAGLIPGKNPTIVLTMQKWWLARSDVFFALFDLKSKDGGKTWTSPRENTNTLGRRSEGGKREVGISDFTPRYHSRSGKLLGTGHTVRYEDNHLVRGAKRSTVWAVYDPEEDSWTPWSELKLPAGIAFSAEGAGSTQRVDLENGDILLPTYISNKETGLYSAVVLRCRFDGKTLEYAEHGDILAFPTGRGFTEPSLAFYKGRYYLTLRNDEAAYVAVSNDGLHFSEPVLWRFDDGQVLGSYNTQQHWITHSEGLFLVYTRRGADNDNVIRHRAPLFMAQVDPEKLVVLRDSEKIVVPNKGAQLGNFGVNHISERETWVTTSEGMSEKEPTKYGADGRVYAARILWSRPNKSWNKN